MNEEQVRKVIEQRNKVRAILGMKLIEYDGQERLVDDGNSHYTKNENGNDRAYQKQAT